MVSLDECKDALALVVFSCLLALTFNYFSPTGIALVGNWNKSEGMVSANAKNGVVEAARDIVLFVCGMYIFYQGRRRPV